MSDRDRQSMGASRSLVPVTVSYTLTADQRQAAWFGPLAPMPAVAPPSVKGRILDYPSGANLAIRPKAYEPISFEQLRNFADAFDLLRIVIETRKDQMSRMNWNVVVREQFKEKKDDEALKTKIDLIREFMLRPDKENFWAEWIKMILEDLFVLDAPAVYRRRTLGGDLYSLDPIDGATIKRVIDENARTPEPPNVAYQQILKGMPAVDYTTEDLIYKPRNKRTHRMYGYSPVEQIVMTINIALRRQIWQLQSFTEGNIPEALIGVPGTWTPDQIKQFQDWFDAILEGNTAQRRKAKFVPGDIAKSFYATKPDKLFDKETEEWLARVVCFAFSVSPQPFIQMMNRATAETAQETAVQDGLSPIMAWVKGLVDTIILEDFEAKELEFVWVEDDELDPDTKSKIIDREHAAGRLTYNEARKEQGLDPIAEPDADRPMMKTASGWVPVFLTPEEKEEKKRMAAQIAGAEKPGEGKPPGGGAADSSDADLSADDEIADIDEEEEPTADEEVGKATNGPFAKTAGVGMAHGKTYVDPERRAAKKQIKAARRTLAAALAALGADVSRQVTEALQALGKAADDPEIDIEAILAALDMEFDVDLSDNLAENLSEVYASSGRLALGQIGVNVVSDLVDQVNDRSVDWASRSAAELVSSIAESTRDMLRSTITTGIEDNLSAEQIGNNIAENYGFSEDRAALIATTEIASANSMGALAGYEEAASEGLTVRKSWLILDDACEDCQANADDGVIDLDQQFSSGDDAPPAHPNCRCVLVPEVEDGDGNAVEAEPVEVE